VRRTRRATSARSESGSALVEFIWLGILLLVPLIYAVLSVFEVQRGAYAVTAASRAAARAYSLAPDDAAGGARARLAAEVALRDQGIERPATVDVHCSPVPGDCLLPGSIISVRVTTQVDLPLLPDALGGNKPSFRLDSLQQVPISLYEEPR
jgi:hypothetical protein